VDAEHGEFRSVTAWDSSAGFGVVCANPHRQRIVERLLHRRVRQVEPLLQKIYLQLSPRKAAGFLAKATEF
jgi:hypothetical protein